MNSSLEISNVKSTASTVYEMLREMILNQKLKPGERLVESKIAEMLNVSITPVRQAFSHLNAQGLITIFPYRGSFVTMLSRETAMDLIGVRAIIEPAVAELAFPNIVRSDADYLRKLCEMSDINMSMGKLIECVECDIMFHDVFFEKCNNKVFGEIWHNLKNKIVYLQCITKGSCSADEKLLVVRHKDIIDSVANYDLQLLKNSIRNHLDYTVNKLDLPSANDITYMG